MSFKIEKCTVFNKFKLEKCTPDFWVFMDKFKKFDVGFVGMWESRRLFQVIVGSVVKS